MKVTLAIASEIDGKQYEQGAVVEVDRATRNNLVHLGRARDATKEESATAPTTEDEGVTPPETAPTPNPGSNRRATNESAPPADGKVK